MPKFVFPTSEHRKQLMEQLAQLEQSEDRTITSGELYRKYAAALKKLDSEMARLSTPDAYGLPKPMTKEDRTKLLQMMMVTAQAGELFLGNMQGKHKSLSKGVPGMVNDLQGMMAKDFDALLYYDPKTARSLPEVQEDARMRTIDLRGKNIRKIGNMQSSRIPLTMVNGKGEQRNGVFTKKSVLADVAWFKGELEKAKAFCDDAGKAALDGFLGACKEKRIGVDTVNTGQIDADTSENMILGRLAQELYHELGFNNLNAETLKKKLRSMSGGKLDPDKLPPEAVNSLTDTFNALKESPGYEINGWNLGLQDGDRLDNRNSCMSAVAGLLGVPGLIAHSEGMKFIGEDGKSTEGTFMDFADGLDLYKNGKLFKHFQTDPYMDPKGRGNLFRQIADLQVLDYICLNVDRHQGNILYQVDKNGNLIGIQGIDNDSSFGRRNQTMADTLALKCISKSMKDKIDRISPEMLRFTLRGRGLSEEEIERSGARLKQLQTAIKNKKVEVLSDKDFEKRQIAAFYPDNERRSNLFKKVGDFMDMGTTYLRDNKIKFEPYEKKDPKLEKVSSAEWTYTMAGVTDVLTEITAPLKNNAKGLVTSHGKSKSFGKLLESVGKVAVQRMEILTDENAKNALLTDPEARPGLRKFQESLGDAYKKAQKYLEYKRKQRGAASVDEIVAKNPYEQSHIDYAKKVLKTVDAYEKLLEGPSNQEERDEMRRNYEARDIRTMKEVRSFEEKNGPAAEGDLKPLSGPQGPGL